MASMLLLVDTIHKNNIVVEAKMVKLCPFYSAVAGHARSDPILSNSCASDHVHTFYGPQNFHPNTSYEDLRDTPPKFSTSPFIENQSLYWHPTIYQVITNNNDGTKSYVRAPKIETSPYYRWDNSVLPKTEAFPPGFRMIAHSNDLGASKSGELGFNMFTECCNLRMEDGEEEEDCQNWNELHFPSQKCDFLGIAFAMPTCWDGSSLGDDNDHKSHMAYTTNGAVNGPCPNGFNHRFPQVQLFVRVLEYQGGTYQLSDGQPIFHVDFFNGWKEGALQAMIDGCDPDYDYEQGDYNPPCSCEPDTGETRFLTPKQEFRAELCESDVRKLIIDENIDTTNELPRGSCNGPPLVAKSWTSLSDSLFSCEYKDEPMFDDGDEGMDGDEPFDEDEDEPEEEDEPDEDEWDGDEPDEGEDEPEEDEHDEDEWDGDEPDEGEDEPGEDEPDEDEWDGDEPDDEGEGEDEDEWDGDEPDEDEDEPEEDEHDEDEWDGDEPHDEAEDEDEPEEDEHDEDEWDGDEPDDEGEGEDEDEWDGDEPDEDEDEPEEDEHDEDEWDGDEPHDEAEDEDEPEEDEHDEDEWDGDEPDDEAEDRDEFGEEDEPDEDFDEGDYGTSTMVKMCLFYESPAGHARSDPIINQICPSDHVHTFYGPLYFHPKTSYEDLRDTPGRLSTAPYLENQSLYWHPTIYQVVENQDNTRTYILAPNLETGPYYRWDNTVLPRTEAFPPGFRMIAHSSDIGAGNGEVGSGTNLGTECCNFVNGEEDYEEWASLNFPQSTCDFLGIWFSMPTCWDGVSLGDDNDHKSHMAYTTNGAVAGPCPDGFDHRFPQIQLFIRVGDYKGGKYQLSDSSEDFHVDFFNGWKEGSLQKIIDNCQPGEGGGFHPECTCTPEEGVNEFLTTNEDVASPVCAADVRDLIVDEEIDYITALPRGTCQGPDLTPRFWTTLSDDLLDCQQSPNIFTPSPLPPASQFVTQAPRDSLSSAASLMGACVTILALPIALSFLF